MRLINTKTLELEEFFDLQVPPYAILSHTWADGEISLQDWADRQNRRYKPGYVKIAAACAQARSDALDFLWVDTNCIDKTSSSELSEAINSMWRWYKRSAVCYAYLADVPQAELEECKETDSAFRRSRWFTRSWTLQELIAPSVVRFFSEDWRELGTKAQLAMAISETTGVGFWCLVRKKHENSLLRYSVAQRMSWASHRQATRVEDRAYSLLGLFDIHMPLVYGEGQAAFTRLLQEIIRKHADQSFLASGLQYLEFLPRSPVDFRHSQNIVAAGSLLLARQHQPHHYPYPFYMANTGLQMTMPIVRTMARDFVFGVLDCWDVETGTTRTQRAISRVWIPLRASGQADIRQYNRLMWPAAFIPIRLLPREEVPSMEKQEEREEKGEEEADEGAAVERGHKEAPGKKFIDFITTSLYSELLIQKAFVSHIRPPKWTRSSAGSPFLVCFPRAGKDGLSDHCCLYQIFPYVDASGKVINPQSAATLPLVLPARWSDRWYEDGVRGEADAGDPVPGDCDGDGSRRQGDGLPTDPVYRALIVIAHDTGSNQTTFSAICLANVLVDGSKPPQYEPRCKIIRHWRPENKVDLRTLDVGTFPTTDVSGGLLVSVQKVFCYGERRLVVEAGKPRSVGFVQVVFDMGGMRADIEADKMVERGIYDRDIWRRSSDKRRNRL